MSRGNARGQAVAELAILLPVLVLIVLGCLDLGRVFSVWLTLSNATREGARYAASNPSKLTGGAPQVIAATLDDIAAQGVPTAGVEVKVLAPSTVDGGQPVTVTARYSVQLATTYLFGAKPVVVAAGTSMVILPGD